MKRWDKIYKKEGKAYTTSLGYLPQLVKLLKKRQAKRVLDLGCGSGSHMLYLAKQGFEVYGIDIAEEGIRIAKERVKEAGLKANLKLGSIHKKLPYRDNFFDALISLRVLNHGRIEEIRRTIREIERVLKPKGLVFITVRKKVAKKYIPKEKLFGIKFIAPRTYVILGGPEKGIPHYRFNKKILRKEFKGFKIIDLWIEPESFYCLLARLSKFG